MNNIYFGFDVEFISVKYNFFFDLGNVFGGILRFVVEDNQSWGVFGGSFYIVDICIKNIVWVGKGIVFDIGGFCIKVRVGVIYKKYNRFNRLEFFFV